MDIVSHAIIGRAVVTPKSTRKEASIIVFFAILPDIFQIPTYIFLGYVNNRFLFFPHNDDWIGFRDAYPHWSQLWEIPHSLFFLIAIIWPVMVWLKLPKVVMLAYFLHIFVDIFTHTGEWAVKPFYPLNFTIEGFTDAWAWHFYFYPISWVLLGVVVIILDKIKVRRYRSTTGSQ